METTSRERITHSVVWSIVALVFVAGCTLMMFRSCEATNKRWQTYTENGYTSINGVWVKVQTTDVAK